MAKDEKITIVDSFQVDTIDGTTAINEWLVSRGLDAKAIINIIPLRGLLFVYVRREVGKSWVEEGH